MIRISNLNSSVKNFLLSNIDLSVKKGEYFVILGPSGSGKTLLIEHIAGLYKPDSGIISLDGADITHTPPESRKVGYVPQDFVLFPFLNVKRNIEFGLSSSKTASDSGSRLSEIIKTLRLDNLLSRDVKTLSGGEKQRVALARALAINPHVLLLDEPFSSLDAGFRYRLWIEMRRIHKELRTTIIHITHDLEEAFTLSDSMAVVMDGRIVQSGAKEDVFFFPRTKAVASFFGIHNIFNGIITDLSIDADASIINCGGYTFVASYRDNAAVGDMVDVCIRPQAIKVIKPGMPIRDNLVENLYTGIVHSSIPHGNTFTFYFKPYDTACADDSNFFEVKLPATAYEKLKIREGKEITVSLHKKAVWILNGN